MTSYCSAIVFFAITAILLTNTSYADAEEFTVAIPFGAYNPSLDTPAENWYEPPTISIQSGDTITWMNSDREGHTVTSGKSAGRFGWMSDDFGTPDEYFDSERFMPGESWSFIFEESGIFSYFCTIHPWMEGYVLVHDVLPDYPQDSDGQEIEEFPVLRYTGDGVVEVNLTWEPAVITTHNKVQFIYQFYDPLTNSNLQKMDYDFIIFQNGKEIFRDHGKNQIGGDYRNFIFSEVGPVRVRLQNIENRNILAEESTVVSNTLVGNNDQRAVEFTAIVYENQEGIQMHQAVVQPAQRLEFQYELAIAIIVIPGALVCFVIIRQMRYKVKSMKKRTPL